MHFLKTEKRRLVGEGRKRNGWMSKLEWQGGGGIEGSWILSALRINSLINILRISILKFI